MCRSSRILCFLLTIAAGPVLAQPGAMRVAGPSGVPNAAVHPGVSTGVQPNRGLMPNVVPGVRPGVGRGIAPNNGVQPGVRSGLGYPGLTIGAFRGRRFGAGGFGVGRSGRFRGRGYDGVDAMGLGLGLAGDLSVPSYGDGAYGEPDPDFVPAYAPPRCIHPLIISIGHGLRHKARTRIVYGQPTACVP